MPDDADNRITAERFFSDAPPSKTKRKEAMRALQDLGERLMELPPERLAKVELPDSLREAIREAHRMTKHEAKRRQMQYIGKLMRDVEPAPIEEALAAFDGLSAAENARLHQLERLRERLLEDEKVLTEIGDAYPGADLQHLRQLRRNAIKEKQENRPPKSFRAIFQMLKDLAAARDAGAAVTAEAQAVDDEE